MANPWEKYKADMAKAASSGTPWERYKASAEFTVPKQAATQQRRTTEGMTKPDIYALGREILGTLKTSPKTEAGAIASTGDADIDDYLLDISSKATAATEDKRDVGQVGRNLRYVAESGKVGLLEGTEGAVNAGSYLGQLNLRAQDLNNASQTKAWGDLLKLLGITDKVSNVGAQELARAETEASQPLETVARFGDNAAKELSEDYGEQTGAAKLAGDVARGAGQLIPSVVASVITGSPAVGLATSSLSAMGNATTEAKDAGKGDTAALGYGLTVGAIEAVTEKLVGGLGGVFGKGFADTAVSKAVSKVLNGTGGDTLAKAVSSIGGEALEEAISEVAGRIANELIIDTDDRSARQTIKDAAYSALVGGILGGAGDAVSHASFGRRKDASEAQNSPAGGVLQGTGADAPVTQNAENSENLGVRESTIVNTDPTQQARANAEMLQDQQAALGGLSSYDIARMIEGDSGTLVGFWYHVDRHAFGPEYEITVINTATGETTRSGGRSNVERPRIAIARIIMNDVFTHNETAEGTGAGVRGLRNRQVNIDNANPAAYNQTNNGGGADGAQLHRTAGERVRTGRDGTGAYSEMAQRGQLGQGDLRDSGVVLLSEQTRNTLTKRGVVPVEYRSSTDKAAFSFALDRARNADARNGWAVSPQSVEGLAQTETYLSPDGSSGFGIAGGDIVGVFANKSEGAPKGVTKTLMPQAIAAGGDRLDCYGEKLVDIYAGFGFVPVARVEFNAEYANPGYTPDKGTPYVYVMMHNGDSADAVVENMGKYPQYSAEQLNALPTYGKDDYDAAIAYRDSLIEQGKTQRATGAAAAGELDTPFNQWRDNSESEQHPMGEKAVRYLGTPVQDRLDPDMRTMKTPQTIAEAAVTTDENAARIENAYYNGDYSYVPETDTQLAEDATASIERNGWDKALTDWTADVRNGKVSPELVAMGAVLINNAGQSKAASAETYADLVLDYSTLLHNAGQALQAARILKMLTPEGRLYGIQKSVQRMSEEMSEYLQKRGIEKVEIPEALFEEYRNAQDDTSRDAVVEKMQQAVADQLPGTWLERWTALRYVNMLGNFKTQVRNLLGNAAMRATYALKNQVANLAEVITSGASSTFGKGKVQRTKSAFVGSDWMRAAKGDYLTVKDAIAGSGKYNDMQDAGNAFERGVQEKRKIFKTATMEGYRKATNWAMEQGDILFSKGIYARSLAGYLKAKGFNPQQLTDGSISTDVLDDARLYAIKEAQEATFRDNNTFSSWVSKIGRRSDTPPLGKALSEGLAPFRKTPANVMVRAEEFSPLGLINTAVTAVKAGKGEASINDVINSFSKTLTGSAMVGLGWLLADMGVLRGVPDEDEQAADALMNYQNYAFVLPNGATYTLDWAAPASLLLFVGAAAQDAYSDRDLSWRDIEGALTSLAEPMVQMSMLSGINDALDGIKYSDNNFFQLAGTLIASYLTQGLTNTLLGQIERISEDTRMATYTKSDSPLPDWLQRAIGKASAKTPLLEFQQTEYLDEFGNTESNGGLGERILENLLSPGYYNKSNEGKPAYDFGYEMNRLLGFDAFPTAYTDSSIEYKDEKYALSQEEKELWQKTRGSISEAQLEAASESDYFAALGNEAKEDVLAALKTHANAQGKNAVLEEKGLKPEISELDEARAALRAGDFVTYYSILTAANDVLDGATAQEVSTLEKLLDMGIPASVGKVLEKDSDFSDMLEAYQAGVSVQHYYDYTVVKSQWNNSPAPGYSSAPNWQKYNAINGMNISEEEKLALIGGVNGDFLGKAQEAINQGVSLSDVLAYYEAITARNAGGEAKNKAEKNNAMWSLGLDDETRGILNRIFG